MDFNPHLEDHVETIARHEEQFLASRSYAERLSDRVAMFIGSLYFVGFHFLGFALWILANIFPRGGHHSDPYPFPLLDAIVAMEAILLASFIVMRQGRLAKRADERDHLMV